jgi:hypothetical protein
VPSLRTLGERIARAKGLNDSESAMLDTEQLIQDLLDDLKRFQ